MPGRSAILAAMAALLAAGAASANQSDPAPAAKDGTAKDLSGVTVTGPAKLDALVNPASQFVRSHLPTSRNEQYARFRDPVCVRVLGLPPEFDAFVAKRVVDLAKAVKAPLDPSPVCTPNVNVIFSPKPQQQLSDIAKRRDILFGYYFRTDAKKIATFDRPIQSWYLTRSVGTDGQDILELNGGPACVSSHGPGAPPCDIKAPPVKGRAGSRLGNDMSSELVHSLILADANRVSGEKIGAVADYIAVLALSRWQGLERCNGIPTILNLLADDCDRDSAPEAATEADLGLLTGLYAVSPRDAGPLQRASIAGRLQAELKKAASAETETR
jgi:hypothetical protein